MKDPVTWWHAIVAFAVGLALSGWGVWVLRRTRHAALRDQDKLDDLEERSEHLLAQLRDLEVQRERLDPNTYATERQRLEMAAADTLRARDAAAAAVQHASSEVRLERQAEEGAKKTAARDTSFWDRHPQLRGFLWGGGTVAVLAVLFGTVMWEQKPRPEGGSLTGNAQSAGPMAQSGGEVSALISRLRDKPDDLEALNRLSHLLLQRQMLAEAAVVTEKALAVNPQDREARVHQAVLQAGTGDSAKAVSMLDELLKDDPNLAEAWFFRGMIGMQTNKPDLAQESWRQFVAVAPPGPQRDRIQKFLDGEGLQMPRARPQ